MKIWEPQETSNHKKVFSTTERGDVCALCPELSGPFCPVQAAQPLHFPADPSPCAPLTPSLQHPAPFVARAAQRNAYFLGFGLLFALLRIRVLELNQQIYDVTQRNMEREKARCEISPPSDGGGVGQGEWGLHR